MLGSVLLAWHATISNLMNYCRFLHIQQLNCDLTKTPFTLRSSFVDGREILFKGIHTARGDKLDQMVIYSKIDCHRLFYIETERSRTSIVLEFELQRKSFCKKIAQ